MSALLRYEVRMFATARLTWCVLALLFGAMAWGALNGERHAREQRAAVERVRQHEAAALAESLAEVARYARPADALLPYWQDPSDVAGFMRYKLVAYAVKPPSPLAGIATGQSRLLPFYLRTELDYVAPPAASFDFVNPRALSLGEFDLAFVLVAVLPLALIALGAPRLAAERDSGALALMAVQLPSFRRLVMLKLGAMALVCVPFCVIAAALALLLAGAPSWSGASGPVLLVLGAALAGYTLFWCCICALVSSRSGVIASYLRLAMLFTVFTFVLPAAGALAIELAYPAPSSLDYLDHLRRAGDLTPAQRNALFLKHLAAFPQYAEAAQRVAQVPYATKMIFVQRDIEQQLRPRQAAALRQQGAARRAAAALRWLSPPMVLGALLQQAAGTDAERHQRFLSGADAYTETLRHFFWPRALEDAARPVIACHGCATRMNFVAHEHMPRFTPVPPLADLARALAPGAGYLILLAVVFLVLTGRRRDTGLP
jgi:ABC-2 type transport system permease protein